MATITPARRVEDRISELSERIADASADELDDIHIELRSALKEYARRHKTRASAIALDSLDLPYERRRSWGPD
jgi:hypothetical protein